MKQYYRNNLIKSKPLPVDIVLSPEWWYVNEGISFDRDFFFHPLKRTEVEQKMEKALYNRWGKFGLGKDKDVTRPEVGAVHLAAGFLLSEMLGCKVDYKDNHPPQVISSAKEDFFIDVEDAFKSEVFKDFKNLMDRLKKKYAYLTGDVNWGGILNIAMDLRGENIMMDLMTNPDGFEQFLDNIANVIQRFTTGIQSETGSSSISVNRLVRFFEKPVLLHSECTHTMISTEVYENFLLKYDIEWSRTYRPFGIHYCGNDPHRYADSFSKITNLDFLDVGWGGDIKILRRALPNTFLNIRLDPVSIINQSVSEIRETVQGLVYDSGNPFLTGLCCINMDDKVGDDKIDAIFQIANEIREEYKNK